MNPPLVSIIVPAYNVESYIAECLDSLVNQTLEDVEIIVVNDGSTDGTGKVIERYAQQYDLVQFLNQENQGLSAARNAGMERASGDYIGFIDSDDWIDRSTYEILYSRARASDADLVVMNGQLYDHITGGLRPIQDFHVWKSLSDKHNELIFSPRSEPDLFMLDTSACKRLYKRSFLQKHDFKFMLGKIFEDVPAHYYLLLKSEVVSLVDMPLYFYRTNRPDRITSRENESLFHVFDVMNRVIDYLYEFEADKVVWANYIWFQSWVLSWLNNQVSSDLKNLFKEKTGEIAVRFNPPGVDEFKIKFAKNEMATRFVARQLTE